MRDEGIKKITMLGMLCAIAYAVMVTVRIPVVLFLKYEPKDIIIAIGGFVYGPMTSVAVSLVVSLIELLTVSDTGLIGFLMNVLSSCSFAYTAAFIYKMMKNIRGAVLGLAIGTVVMCAVMVAWNYMITPLYMNVPRAEVAGLLLPAILPFNILKGTLNSVVTFVLYKPLVNGLRKAKLVPMSNSDVSPNKNITSILIASFLFVTCVIAILVFRGII